MHVEGPLQGKRVFVTGATGVLGSHLCRSLLDLGAEVMGQGRDPARRAAIAARGVRLADPLEPFKDPALRAFAPEITINAAGIAGGTLRWRDYEVANVAMVEDIIRLHRLVGGGRIVQVSSPSVTWRATDQFGIREDEPFTPPVSLYAKSKQIAEDRLRQAADCEVVIARFRAIYGQGVPSMVSRLADQVISGPVPLVRGGSVRIDLLHIDDGVSGLLALASASGVAGGTYNMAGPEPVSFRYLVDKIAAEAGVAPRYVPVPGGLLRLGGSVLERVFSILNPGGEPPLTRHSAGALCYSQTLDLTRIIEATGWHPQRRIDDLTLMKKPA